MQHSSSGSRPLNEPDGQHAAGYGVALVEGDTEAYERIETVLKGLGYEEGDASFRWHRRGGIGLTVERFCPASEQRPAGQVFRPALADNPVGKHNFGGRLSALALDAGELLTTDVEVIHRSIVLPQHKGTLDMDLRVTGPLAFLTAKIDALRGRDKPKDAYDIVWLIESWPGAPAAAAQSFARRPTFQRPEVATALAAIREAFAGTDRIGARSYARFRQPTPERSHNWSAALSAPSPSSPPRYRIGAEEERRRTTWSLSSGPLRVGPPQPSLMSSGAGQRRPRTARALDSPSGPARGHAVVRMVGSTEVPPEARMDVLPPSL